MNHPIHALDSFFYTSMGVYEFQSQCEMLAELGYDGITVAAWGGTPYTDLSLLPGVKARHGLDVASLYVVLHEGRNDAALRRIVESVRVPQNDDRQNCALLIARRRRGPPPRRSRPAGPRSC